MTADKAYIATLLRKRAHYVKCGNDDRRNEMDSLLSRAGYKPEPEPAAPAPGPAPKDRSTSPVRRTVAR